jgi:hypothetical protein
MHWCSTSELGRMHSLSLVNSGSHERGRLFLDSIEFIGSNARTSIVSIFGTSSGE